MSGKWDNAMKRLIQANPQAFIDWLLDGAVVVREISVELNRDISIDSAYESMYEDERIIVHVEFQRFDSKVMARRVLEYNAYLTWKYGCPVESFVIYLKQEGPIVGSPLVSRRRRGSEIWRFNFTNMPLWEVPTDMLRDVASVGILPLLPLTKGGNAPAVIDEVLTRIEQAPIERGQRANLLTTAFTLAKLALGKPEQIDWLIKRFYMYQDLIRDTEIYQLILQEGVELGKKEGVELGKKEGMEREREQEVQRNRQGILSLVQAHFSELLNEAEVRVSAISDVLLLHQLFLGIAQAKTLEEARAILVSSQAGEKH